MRHNPPFILLALALLTSWVSADEVTIVADRYYPYNGIPSDPRPGYMIEIAQYALAKAGHTVKYQLMAWDRAVEQVEQGKKDCIVAVFHSDAPSLVFPEVSQGADQMAFYALSENDWRFSGVESLHDIRLGVTESYTYQDDIDVYIDSAKEGSMVTAWRGKFALEYNLMALVEGDVDIVLESQPVVTAALKKLKLEDKVHYVGAADKLSKSYVACSPKIESSQAYVELISDATLELRESGELENLLAKYGLTDWVDSGATDN